MVIALVGTPPAVADLYLRRAVVVVAVCLHPTATRTQRILGREAVQLLIHYLSDRVCFCTCAAGIERALSLELDGHPGGYQYLCFRLRMLMCGGLRGMAAETDAISRSIASARRLHDAKKLRLRPGAVCTLCVESGCDCGPF